MPPDLPAIEYDLEAARQRVRRRQAGYMGLVVGPIILVGSAFVLAMKLLDPGDYPPGDVRNEPLFWLAFGAVQLAIATYVSSATSGPANGEARRRRQER